MLMIFLFEKLSEWSDCFSNYGKIGKIVFLRPSSQTTNKVKDIFRALSTVSQQVSFRVAGRILFR